ncbi:hypothetical protein H9X96_01055 [Pedobacter sp. N36a]|uniref:hypothetical protein n=1 Tax=Pedobacter sp. N36a TaxID=2767996 RepID=UPI001656F383|nr:hypothetical protein [Pedobacter sp. N36a]MBC8984357.1 hypothetical protein [Pedobacter sp. N36a]
MNFKSFRLLLTFYSNFFPATFVTSIACASLFAYLGMPALTILIWFKIATLGIVAYYISKYKYKEFLYYQNLGIPRTFLWSGTMLLEFLIFFFLFLLSGKFPGLSINFFNLFV